MNFVSRTITGGGIILIGLILFIIPFFGYFKSGWFVAWIYGIPLLIIGFFIFFNKKEDEIEKIKNINLKGGQKK